MAIDPPPQAPGLLGDVATSSCALADGDERLPRTLVQPLHRDPPQPHRTTRAERRAMRKERPQRPPSRSRRRAVADASGRPIIRPIHDDVEGRDDRRPSRLRNGVRQLRPGPDPVDPRGLRRRRSASTTRSTNAALAALIACVQPRDEVEAVLATQMAVTHVVAMRLLGRTGMTTPTLPHFAATGSRHEIPQGVRQVEALAKLRRPAVQTVRVERVTVQAAGRPSSGWSTTSPARVEGGQETREATMNRESKEPEGLRRSHPVAEPGRGPVRPARRRPCAGRSSKHQRNQ